MSVAARITALVSAVAILVGVVAGVLALQLLRASLEEQMRAQLRQQLGVAAAEPDPEAGVAEALAWAEESGALAAAVEPDGTVHGTAAQYLSDDVVAELRAGRSVSDRKFNWTEPVVLEGATVGDYGLILARSDLVLNTATRDLLFRIVPLLALGVAVAIAGGTVLARRIARPLVATAVVADRLARGERGIAAPSSTIPEIQAVAAAFAALDESLSRSEHRQREFLLSISHEIRTPLTAIRGYGEALIDEVIAPAIAGEVLQAEADRLRHFVEDLLELARLEADDFRIERSDADLRDVVLGAERAWRAQAFRLAVRIQVIHPDRPVQASTDVRRMRQVIDGLIENALRVSPPDTVVTIRLSADEVARISVEDEGPGLSDDDLADAFERGLLRDRYQHTRPVGTGLGLNIASRLVERLGGSISAHRCAGGGTMVVVSLHRWADGSAD